MKTAIAGTLVLVLAVTGCQKRDAQPSDDGFGAGATPPAATDTTTIDTMRTPAVPDDSLRIRDTTARPQ